MVSGQKFGNELFTKFWKNTLQEAYSKNSNLSLDDIYIFVWKPCLKQCKQLLESLIELKMKLSDVDVVLGPHKARLETQLQSLFKGVNEISHVPASISLMDRAAKRVREYWNLRRYQQGAETFLQLKNSLGLTKGDFQIVEKLSQQV